MQGMFLTSCLNISEEHLRVVLILYWPSCGTVSDQGTLYETKFCSSDFNGTCMKASRCAKHTACRYCLLSAMCSAGRRFFVWVVHEYPDRFILVCTCFVTGTQTMAFRRWRSYLARSVQPSLMMTQHLRGWRFNVSSTNFLGIAI